MTVEMAGPRVQYTDKHWNDDKIGEEQNTQH